jgi:hypothetical protein
MRAFLECDQQACPSLHAYSAGTRARVRARARARIARAFENPGSGSHARAGWGYII